MSNMGLPQESVSIEEQGMETEINTVKEQDVITNDNTLPEFQVVYDNVLTFDNTYQGTSFPKDDKKYVLAVNSVVFNESKIETLDNFPIPTHYLQEMYFIKCDIKSLLGTPECLTVLFIDSCNNLTSLECTTHTVKGSISIVRCEGIRDLTGMPQNVGVNLVISGNSNLESLYGCPAYMDREPYINTLSSQYLEQPIVFECCFNPVLKSLEYSPKEVDQVICIGTGITSLVGCPECDTGIFDFNTNLKTLRGCPETIRSISLQGCALDDPEIVGYLPKELDYLNLSDNPYKFTINDLVKFNINVAKLIL